MSQESGSDISEMGGVVQKRRREFSSEDEGLNLSKYRKLTTEQKIKDFKKEDVASDTSSYETEEEGDESYVDDENKSPINEVVPDSDEQQGNSHSSTDCNPEDETNTPSTIEQEYHCTETGSETDVDSLNVSPTEELNLLENSRKPIEKVQRLAFISATYRMSSHTMNTKKFSCNADVTVNSNFTYNEVINRTVKKSNSGLYNNDETDEIVEANNIPNGREDTGSDNTELEKVTKAECINTQDLPDTQIMDSENFAELECMDTAKVVQPQSIKSEKASQVIAAENIETFSDNICPENENMASENIGSEYGETVSDNINSGYEKAVSDCEDTGTNSTELKKVAKIEYLNTQDLPDTQIIDSESIEEIEYMDTENVEQPENIKSEIASQVTIPANVDPQYVENLPENTDSENRKTMSENINSEYENIDSGYENAVSEHVDSENEQATIENINSVNEKTMIQNIDIEKESAVTETVENNITVLRNMNTENVVEQLDIVDAVDTTDEQSKAMNSNSENVSTLLTNTNSTNDEQTESMDVESSGVESTKAEMNTSITEQINQKEAPKSHINECSASENSNRPQTNENEQDAAIRNLLSHAHFEIISEPTDDNPTYLLNKNDTIGEDPQVVSEVIIPGNVEEVYTEPNNSSNAPTYEHSYQTPSTSGVVEEVITDASRASSVSDLNLAQLVLSLKQDIQELTKKVDKQGNVLEAVVNANEINLTPLFAQTFQEKYNLQIPFTKIEDFDKFNQDLAKNTRFCNEFITSLCSYIDNNVTLTKNIMSMLRKYMSKELASLYTASKATGSKMVLKDTLFCKCLLQATKLTIRNGLLPLEHEKAFMKSLGLVVSGAKSWVVHDDERRKSSQS